MCVLLHYCTAQFMCIHSFIDRVKLWMKAAVNLMMPLSLLKLEVQWQSASSHLRTCGTVGPLWPLCCTVETFSLGVSWHAADFQCCSNNFILAAEVEKRNMPVAFIENKEITQVIAEILCVKPEQLEKALCTRSTVTQGETIISPVSSATSVNVRDAFVKGVYGRLFIWVVNKINEAIYKPTVRTRLSVLWTLWTYFHGPFFQCNGSCHIKLSCYIVSQAYAN